MMESCIDAGLIHRNTDKSLFFALEPEAASLYCSINKEIDRKYFNKGEYYIVCDLGGGTGDIVAHLVGSNNNLNEISPSCGGNFGSNEIDKFIFKDIIFKLFGCQDFNTFYLKYKKKNISNGGDESDKNELFNDWNEIEREIKDFKEGAKNSKIEKFDIQIIIYLYKMVFDSTFSKELSKYLSNITYGIIYPLLISSEEEINNLENDPYGNNYANFIYDLVNKKSLKQLKTVNIFHYFYIQ